MFKNNILHFGRKEGHFKKEMHNFRTLESWYGFQPLMHVNMDFRGRVRQKLNADICLTLRQISDCKCRPLYQISH